VKFDSDGIKFWRNIKRSLKNSSKSMELMITAQKAGVLGGELSNDIDNWFGTAGRKRIETPAGQMGSYDAIQKAHKPRKRPPSELQTYWVLDASIRDDVAQAMGVETSVVQAQVDEISKVLIKKFKQGKNKVPIDQAIKTIKNLIKKANDEQLQGALSVFQLYGVVEGGGGPVTKPPVEKPSAEKPSATKPAREPKQLALPLQESKTFDRWKKMAGILKG